MDEETKRTGYIVLGILAILSTLIVTVYKGCENTEERKLECVKLGRSPVECDCLYSSRPCPEDK